MSVPFVGPSYNLPAWPADVQRTIGMIPVPLEPGNGKSLWAFRDAPGLVEFADLGQPIRGLYRAADRVFAVAGSVLYEILETGVTVSRGSLSSSADAVGMSANSVQLAVSDGALLYALTLADNTLESVAFPGGAKIEYLNQRILFVHRDSQRFGWTGLVDAQTIGALSFASAESSPDKLTGLAVNNLEVFLFGTETGEPWQNTTSASIFERNDGGVFQVGAVAEFSIQKLDTSLVWLASSVQGQGAVFMLLGYSPRRISTQLVEQRLAGLDLSQAYAFTYEADRSLFYVLQVPGLDSTLVYDAFSGQWHEMVELVNGEYTRWRANSHVFAFGYNLVGDSAGKVYRLDNDTHTNAGDPLVRDRIMPTLATPGRKRVHPNRFVLDCERGTGGQAAFRYSIDGGRTWSGWKAKSLGAIGDYGKLVQWKRLNAGRDIVVQVRCTDDVPFNPVSGGLE